MQGKNKKGLLFVIGTGPGNSSHISFRAYDSIRKSEIIIGYSTYILLIREMLEKKKVYKSGMRDEVKRAELAVSLASEGKKVSIISGGDAGIYGMAGVVCEVMRNKEIKFGELFDMEIVPGIPAFCASSSLLGAPLMNDFAVVSLSDILNSWEKIKVRLENAAKADFVIVIYNPKSKKRIDNIVKARDIILSYRKKETPVGIVMNAFREGQSVIITNIEDMLKYPVDMSTTVIIGNSETFTYGDFIITPRGYRYE